ncbi:acyl-CoA dehydrogenase, middle domain protein [Mycobacterium xenopi 4042]|uniref:Acyl-CoA dehydrogenase, middle domain protein n=1 Tax=Mycobacterium xenopi 4042 TaxID=1299334 RepID=X7ZJJ2_MYCXE|nr:acyl-CoA dehydrogenase, middle domain protein [Mycobacterium xenopi 4042]
MTEPQGGADPRVFTTRAVRDGDDWVITGRKYFSSNASVASFFIVVAITDPDVPVHRGASTFLVPAGTPGLVIEATHHLAGAHPHEPGHSLVRYDEVRVPADALLGEPGQGFMILQTRLAAAGYTTRCAPSGWPARHRHDGAAREKPFHPGQFTG